MTIKAIINAHVNKTKIILSVFQENAISVFLLQHFTFNEMLLAVSRISEIYKKCMNAICL